MSATEFIFSTGYLVGALMLGLGVVLFFASLLHAERHFGTWAKPALIPIVALGICVSSVLSGRSLKNAATDLTLNTEGLASEGSLALRLLTLVLIGVCAARVGGQWLSPRKSNATGGAALFAAFVAFFLSHSVLNSVFGTQPAFIHNLFYPIFAFAAVYAARSEPLSLTISIAKATLFTMMFLSLALAVVKPDLALEPGYVGWIPGLDVRLWGVGSNANSIGPLALVALLLEYMQPYQKKWLKWLCVTATLTVLLLAQSKTVWFAGALLLPVLAWYSKERVKQGISIPIALGLITMASVALLAILIADPVSLWTKISDTKFGTQITTLTGRGQIWFVAINEWLNNPLFGYGPNIWGPAHRDRIGMQFAFSAHNQFLQSLSAAGIFGFMSLIAYLWLLGRYALRMAVATKGVSAALFVLIMVRSMTETPLTLGTLFNGELLMHLLLYQVAMHGATKQNSTNFQNRDIAVELQLTKIPNLNYRQIG